MTPTTTQGRAKKANWWENDPLAPEQPSAKTYIPESEVTGKPTYIPEHEVTGRGASGNWWESDPLASDIESDNPSAAQTRKPRTAGDVAADLAKGFGGAAVSAVGAVPTAVGRAVQEGSEMLFGLTMDEAKRLAEAEGTPEKALEWYERANRLNPVSATGRAIESGGRWVSRQGDRLRDARSDEAKELARQSTPDGDITKPSTWTMGENPTVEGVAQVAADVMGSMAPPVATAIATRGRSATTQIRAGGATVAGQIAGAAMEEAGTYLGQFNDDQLRQVSPVFRDLEARGYSAADARTILEREAENRAAAYAAPVGYAGGQATGAILGKAGERLAGKFAGALPKAVVLGTLGATEEALQEVFEGVATRAGINDAAGTDRSLTEGTFGEAVLGAKGGGVTGAGRGAALGISERFSRSREEPAATGTTPPSAVPGTSASADDSTSAIERAMASRSVSGPATGSPAAAPATERPRQRPEARLAELDILKMYRPLNEVELNEGIALLQEIMDKQAGEASTPQAPADQIVQPEQPAAAEANPEPAIPAPELPATDDGIDVEETRIGLQVDSADADSLIEFLRTDTDPSTGRPIHSQGRRNELMAELENLEGAIATAQEFLQRTERPTPQAPTNFWSYVKEHGYTPGQVKKGTELWTTLKADFDRAKANAKRTSSPTSILPAPTTQPINQTSPQKVDRVMPASIAPAPGIDPALQNRDRSRAASVAQMADIARNPDYMRLATSRTPDAGAPMVFIVGDDIDQIPEGNEGRADVAVMADGQRVPFRYAVVDARTVQPSNFADGRVNDAYTVNMPGTIKALNNGRTAGLRAAYEQGTAGNYQAELIADAAAHGVPVEAIQRTPNPILVRVYSEQSNTPDMAAKSQGQGLGMSPTELARQDAPLIDANVLAAYQPGDVTTAANRDFVRAFVGKLNQAGQDVAGMMTAEGSLSPAGRQRIQAALMQAAYGDADLVTELFDSLDTDIKAIGEALKAVAGEWANMRDSARQGLINPDADITDNLVQAVNLVRKARRDNSSLYDLVNQTDLMTGEVPDPLTVGALRFFYPSQYMTRAAGREAIVSALRDYTHSAMGTTAGADMFGQVVTPSDILNGITDQGANNAQDPTQEGGRGADSRGTDGRRADAPGQGTEPVGNDRAGQEAGADRQGERENTAREVRSSNPQASEGDEAKGLDALTQEELLARMGRSPMGAEPTNAERLAVGSMLQEGTVLASAGMTSGITGRVARISISDQYRTARYFVHLHWHDNGKPRKITSQGGSAYHHDFFVRDGKLYSEDSFGDRGALKQEWSIISGAKQSATASGIDQAGRFPAIGTITNLSVGPAGLMTPRPIAPGRQLYRETNLSGLDDLLRQDGQADVAGFFVTDNPDLALGQGDNQGVQVVFRADSLSGREHRKPMTGDTAGREYKTDMAAPRAVQTITMKAVDVVRLRGLTRRTLADFDKEVLGDGLVRYHRKGLPRAQGEVLSAYTPQEVIERQEAAENERRQREANDRTAAEQERQRQEREEIRRRSEAAADDFQLGQDPMASLTGQRSVFDAEREESQPTRQARIRNQQPATDESIQDVGEQLYANRRNFTGRGIKWEDVQDLNDTLKVKEVTKAKVWPRPNYEQLVADGMPAVLARMVKHVYDGLSAGPTIKSGTPPSDADLKRYIDTLAKVREGLFGFINDRQMVADFAKGVLTMVKGEPTALGPVSILDMAKQSMDAREISTVLLRRVWPEQFAANVPTMGRFTRGSEAQKDVSIIGGNKAIGALQFDRNDISKWVGDLGKGWPTKREAWQVQGYQVLAPGEYTAAGQEQSDGSTRMSIRPKQGRGSWRAVFTDAQMTNPPFVLVQDGGFGAEAFTTREAAIEAAREKVKRSPGAGQDIRGTNIEEAERTGPSRRQDGEDITPQRLMEAFGFRGVNFGREGWIKQAERQEYLNQAYDGLMDLADILGVPPKAMSLDGKLGIAFGAQGKGGGFAAHFVPGYNEINLTKTKGAGTLAHEWGHALDHHFATLAALEKDKEPFLSEHANQPDTRDRMVFEDGKYVRKNLKTFGDGIRPEIVQAFRAIYQAMEKRNEAPGEMVARRDAAKASALKRLDGWIKAARRQIEESAAANKADLLAEFDQHAEKFRKGDTGDGYEKAGKQVFSARVAAVRNLIKDATGRLWSADDTNGLESNASYVKSLLGKQDADTTHEPQKVATKYKADSAAMDKEKGGKAYWATPTEMFARAFELYVHDKLSQRQQRNTFLTDAELRASKPVQIPDESSAKARGAGAMRDLYLYPVGKERETLREAFDNLVGQIKTKETDKGLTLYEPDGIAYTGDRYGTDDSRRGADQPAGSARTGSAAADGVRGNRGAVPGRARITALGIAADIERTGSAALIGRTVSTPDELAELAQVYRDPRFETFRVFFTRSNRILHATGVSARLPGQTPMVPAGMTESEYIQAFKDQMETTGADGYYILHNHPSGDPTPSRDDERVTDYLAAQVPGLKGHVVINSNRYAVIQPGQAVEVKDKVFGPDLLRIPSLPSPILNASIGKPDDLVTLGKSLQKPGWLTLIGTDSGNRVRLTADVPASALSREPRVLAGQVRRLMRQSGSRNMHLVGSDADVASAPVQQALREGILRDAVGTTGRTQAERGVGASGPGFTRTAGRIVSEGTDYGRQDQTQTETFRRWFGDSKVVDANGRPLVVYHGTDATFSVFDTVGGSTPGSWFTADQSGAEVFGVPVAAYLAIRNPGTLNDLAAARRDAARQYDPMEQPRAFNEAVVSALESRGIDGIRAEGFQGAGGSNVWMALRPTQIKSVFNRGTFDPNDSSIVREDEPGYRRDSIGNNPPPQPGPDQQNAWTRAKAKAMELTSPSAIDKLIYEFQDKYVDLKRLRDHIKAIGGTITDLNDAYLGEELYHKRLAKRTEDFLDKELKPLLADMRSRSVSLLELERYLHARHAPEANKELAERNPNRAMIEAGKAESKRVVRDLELQLQRAKAQGSATRAIEEALEEARDEAATWNGAQAFRGTEAERLSLSGMSDAEAKAYMDGLTPRQRENFQELAERVDAIQAKTLEMLESYGLMDKATLNAWRSAYQFYVPLHRDEAKPESDRHPIGQGFSVKGTGMKSRVGSNEKVTNILAHIAMQRETALTRGEKNHVVKKLYLMAAQNPDEDFWEIDKPPQIKTIDPRTGFVRSGIDPTYKHRPNVVMVRIAGRDQAIVFNEQNPNAVRLAEAMKNLDVGDLHVVLGLAAKGTRWFASVNTQYNPIFGLINFARDVQAGLLNLSTTELAGKQKEVASHVFTAMRAIYRERRGKSAKSRQWTRLWDEFQDVGGTTGYRDLFTDAQDRADALTKELNALDRGQISKAAHAVVDWLSDYNETMENAVRLAAYKVALDEGMTKERAASLAKNITVNFNRKGRQTREIGALYAFFNAALQGTARMVETLRGPVGKRIMYGGVLLGAVNTLIGMAMMGGDDENEADNWDQIPEFIKERSIIIPLGREDYITIPMPLGFHVFPNIGRIAVEYALGGPDKSLGGQIGNLLLAITDAFNPLGGAQNLGQLAAPTVIDPIVALMQNKDWTGKPIYRENANGLDPQPGHRLVKDSASTPSRAVAEAINKITGGTDYRPGAWSPTPDQLDYVIGQLTGGLGRELLKVNQTLSSTVTGDELPPYKIPLVGRVYGNTRGPAGQSGRYYENVRLLNEIENEYKGRLRNREDVTELRENEPLVGLIGLGNATENQVRKLNTLRRQITERKEEGYQERAREIDARVSELMTRLNTEVAKARREAAR